MAQCDTFTTAHQVLAGIYLKLGHREDAAAVLRKSVAHNPNVVTMTALAKVLLWLQRYDEVEDVLAQAQLVEPDNGELVMIRGDCLARQGRYLEAVRLYEQAIDMDENRVGIPARKRIERAKSQMPDPGSD
ncbi:MAG: tetratricopeptide repeat protein [Planctomycetota bacterium]